MMLKQSLFLTDTHEFIDVSEIGHQRWILANENIPHDISDGLDQNEDYSLHLKYMKMGWIRIGIHLDIRSVAFDAYDAGIIRKAKTYLEFLLLKHRPKSVSFDIGLVGTVVTIDDENDMQSVMTFINTGRIDFKCMRQFPLEVNGINVSIDPKEIAKLSILG